IYFETYASWASRYHTHGNPLFVPEARGSDAGAANAFYTFGQHDAIGFCPFAVDAENAASPIARAYAALKELSPLILDKQGTGDMAGVVLEPEATAGEVELGGYRMRVVWAREPRALSIGELQDRNATLPRAGVLFIHAGPDEFYVSGNGGVLVYFTSLQGKAPLTGIESLDEGSFIDGQWKPGRRLNGDENGQGQLLRLPAGSDDGVRIYRVRLYGYR
ncbi:MAG: DUF5597 domain-containing protein, partial [Acidobacteriaceae bacterium]|nr:DUF5597 domain-containing protein [Acidobacteriaceae bacterium]